MTTERQQTEQAWHADCALDEQGYCISETHLPPCNCDQNAWPSGGHRDFCDFARAWQAKPRVGPMPKVAPKQKVTE